MRYHTKKLLTYGTLYDIIDAEKENKMQYQKESGNSPFEDMRRLARPTNQTMSVLRLPV